MNFYRSRGTSDSPVAVQAYDYGGIINSYQFDGTSWVNNATINFQPTSVATGILPTEIEFRVMDTSGAMQDVFEVNWLQAKSFKSIEAVQGITVNAKQLVDSNLNVTANSFGTHGGTTNSDVSGAVSLSGGVGTYSFLGTYPNGPICTATDISAANAVQVTTSTTTLTLHGTGSDLIGYICMVRY